MTFFLTKLVTKLAPVTAVTVSKSIYFGANNNSYNNYIQHNVL